MENSNDVLSAGLEAFAVNTGVNQGARSITALDYAAMAEAAALLESEVSRAQTQMTFMGTLEAIGEYVKSENAVLSGGLAAVFGSTIERAVGKFDANDVPGTTAAITAGLEGFWEKAVQTINTIIERIRTFLAKVLKTYQGFLTKLTKAEMRLKTANGKGVKLAWKKTKRILLVPGNVSESVAASSLKSADSVLEQAKTDITKFSDAGLGADFMNGAILKQMRLLAAKTSEFRCESQACDYEKLKKLIADAKANLAALRAVEGSYKLAKSLKVVAKKMENTNPGSTVKATKAFTAAASVYSWYGLYYMKNVAYVLSVLANVKTK